MKRTNKKLMHVEQEQLVQSQKPLQQQQQKEQQKKVAYKTKYSPYQKLLNSIHTSETRKTYLFHFNKFFQFSGFKNYSQLLDIDNIPDLIQDFIQTYKKRGLSYQTMNTAFAAIKLFYESNDVENLPWKRLARQKGKKKRIVDDRLYTPEELKVLIDNADLREKVAILTMLTSGMRVGALAELKWGDVESIPQHDIYKFKPYSQDLEERYITFCTPECANYIRQYKKYREEKEGERITKDSAFITHKITSRKRIIHKGFFMSKSLQKVLERQRYDANVMKPIKLTKGIADKLQGKIRKDVMRTHVFRKMFATTCNKVGMNITIKEKLLGHKSGQGLDIHYDRTTEETFIREYLKVVDELTINEENRLKRENIQLHKEVEDINLLKQKVDELTKENKKTKEELDALWEQK